MKYFSPKLRLFPILLFTLFSSCISQTKSPLTTDNNDSCSLAKKSEIADLTLTGKNSNFTETLNNYWGDDTTKLDFQHFFEHVELVKSISYYENGKVQEELFYKCGALNGVQNFYHKNGNLARIIPYSYGYRKGVGEEYDESGVLQQRVLFDADSFIKQIIPVDTIKQNKRQL